MSIPWPEDLCSGIATWWLGYIAADTEEDDDRDPQLKAGAGIRVNFVPDVANAVTYRGVEGVKTVMPLESTGVIDEDGYLCTMREDGTAGTRGVVLPSSECETLTPQDWTWTVTVTENRIRINRFSISVSPGETIDLADYVPVESSGGTHIVTEIETAERAEKAASQAGIYRQETKTDREATQRLRNEAESFRDAAGSSATSSAQSATTAGEILEQMQGMEITVDTSVGTRVFVGDTMIYGDTGWRRIVAWRADGIPYEGQFPEGFSARPGTSGSYHAGDIRIRRINDSVLFQYSSVQIDARRVDIPAPRAFTANRNSAALSVPTIFRSSNWTHILPGYADIRIDEIRLLYPDEAVGKVSTSETSNFITWTTASDWPTSLPGIST